MKNFEIGKTYFGRSVCDHDCKFVETIVSRTAKTVSTISGKTFRVSVWSGVEQFKPCGSYSMAPIISADKVSA